MNQTLWTLGAHLGTIPNGPQGINLLRDNDDFYEQLDRITGKESKNTPELIIIDDSFNPEWDVNSHTPVNITEEPIKPGYSSSKNTDLSSSSHTKRMNSSKDDWGKEFFYQKNSISFIIIFLDTFPFRIIRTLPLLKYSKSIYRKYTWKTRYWPLK